MGETDDERVLGLHLVGEGLAVPDWVHFIGGTMSRRSRLRVFFTLCYFFLPFAFFLPSGGVLGILLGLGLGGLNAWAYVRLGYSHFPAALLPLAILTLIYLRWSEGSLGGGGELVLMLGLGLPAVISLFNELVEMAQARGNPWLVLSRDGAYAICYRSRLSKKVKWSVPWSAVLLGVEAHEGVEGKSGPAVTQYFLVASPTSENPVRIHQFAKDQGHKNNARMKLFKERLPSLHAAVGRWLCEGELGGRVEARGWT